jgi:hypothetical protein
MTKPTRTSAWLPFVIASSSLALWFGAWKWHGARDPLHGYTFATLVGLYGSEASFYVAVATVQLFVTLGFASFASRRWGLAIDRQFAPLFERPRAAMGALAFLGAVIAFGIALLAVGLHTLNEDEKTYLFQAKLVLLGRLTIDVPPESAQFWQPFIVGTHGKWSGQYFWAQPLFLAGGQAVGLPWIVPPIELAITIYFTGRMVEEVTENARTAVIAAALAATSPLLLFTAGSLHNANLAASCSAVSLYAIARLYRAPNRAATVLLGLSTAVALHNRPLDHGALVFGAAIIASVACGSLPRTVAFARRLLPAVAITLPFLALHPFINHAISGNAWHSGYWLFNEGQGWTTMGFGRGPFGDPHTPTIAAAKTITSTVRSAFYTFGGPLVFVLPVALTLAPRAPRIILAAILVVAVYGVAYFFYAGSPVYTTGPVYYVALVPVLAALVAVSASHVHGKLVALDGYARAVPAFLAAHVLAAILVFCPSALLELSSASADAANCDLAGARVAVNGPAMVFVDIERVPQRSWTGWPPMPSPRFDDHVLFPRTQGPVIDALVFARFGAGRSAYYSTCWHGSPFVLRYDPATGRRWRIEPN